MGEILYRAISLCKGEHWLYGQPRHYAHNPHTEKWTIYDPATGIETDIVEETLGQYTGLTDKNGTKIFEGDIINFTNVDYPDCEITFDNGSFVYNEIGEDNIICELRFRLVNEVIGNIHDNPELIAKRRRQMTPPKKIFLQVCGTCKDNECDKCDFNNLSEVTWCKDRINDNDVAYFSEQAIREAALDMLYTSWADSNFDKAIEFMIEQLKGGNNG